MLIHVEVQGYDDKDFAKRMFTYFYRILDIYEKPITAIAIFTDTNKKFHPKLYVYEKLGTKITYQFNTYQIIEQDEKALARNNNPFAIVILTVLLALKRKKLDDDDLLQLKIQIFRNLHARNIDETKMRGLSTFLNLYMHFAKLETSIKFEQEIQILTENRKTMGLEEMVLDRAKKLGMKEGMEKGKEIKNYEIIANLMITKKFSGSEIANILNITELFVLKVQDELK